MAKKRTAAAESTEDTSFDPSTFDRQEQAAAVVQELAESTRLPDDQPSHTAQHAPRQSHAAAVGRKPEFKAAPNPFPQETDVLAGVRLMEGNRTVNGQRVRESILAFEEKPSQDVLDKLKDSGFQWNGPAKFWTREVRPDSVLRDALGAETVFRDVCKAIREERGITHSVGMSV